MNKEQWGLITERLCLLDIKYVNTVSTTQKQDGDSVCNCDCNCYMNIE